MFGAAVTVMTGINIAAGPAAAVLRWHQIPPAITADIIPTLIFRGVFSPFSVEAFAMVIAAYYTREQRGAKAREEQRKAQQELREAREENRKASEKARTEGLEQGREESNAAWREWLARMQAAQAAGEPFDEPPPDVNGVRRPCCQGNSVCGRSTPRPGWQPAAAGTPPRKWRTGRR